MRKHPTSLVAVVALTAAGLAGCGSGSPVVSIWTYIPGDVGPYEVVIDAADRTSGEILPQRREPVASGEYGPSAITYPAGHVVDIKVSITLTANIPSLSWIRLQDGGITKPKKTCTPLGKISTLECTITTKF
jgi:hypothetical protein